MFKLLDEAVLEEVVSGVGKDVVATWTGQDRTEGRDRE